MFLEHQNQHILKDNVTLNTEIMANENSALPL